MILANKYVSQKTNRFLSNRVVNSYIQLKNQHAKPNWNKDQMSIWRQKTNQSASWKSPGKDYIDLSQNTILSSL